MASTAMSPVEINVFVGAADVLEEMIRNGLDAAIVDCADAGAPGIGALGTAAAPAAPDATVAPTVPAASTGRGRAMRWNNNTSGFVLRRLLSDGSRPDKVFKDKDVNLVAKAMKDFCGEVVSPTQVYNHLRKWR